MLCRKVVKNKALRTAQEIIRSEQSVENLNIELNKHFQKIFADLTLKIQASKDENIKIEDAFKKIIR